MYCFLIFLESSEDSEKITRAFPEKFHSLSDQVFLVATDRPLSSMVCEKVGINAEKKVAGIVLPIENNNYNGFYNPKVWELLGLWGEQE